MLNYGLTRVRATSTAVDYSQKGSVNVGEALAYEYDFFVSYRRHDPLVVEWVRGSLVPYLKPFVEAELGRPVTHFVDQQIEAGDMWPERLEKALRTSAVLVPLLSKLYFTSEWCAREYDHFRDREITNGFRTVDTPEGLIVAAAIHDGEEFPAHARKLQLANFEDYLCLTIKQDNSAVLQPFLKMIRPFAKAVADAIRRAPPPGELRRSTQGSEEGLQAAGRSLDLPRSLEEVPFQKLPPRMILK